MNKQEVLSFKEQEKTDWGQRRELIQENPGKGCLSSVPSSLSSVSVEVEVRRQPFPSPWAMASASRHQGHRWAQNPIQLERNLTEAKTGWWSPTWDGDNGARGSSVSSSWRGKGRNSFSQKPIVGKEWMRTAESKASILYKGNLRRTSVKTRNKARTPTVFPSP